MKIYVATKFEEGPFARKVMESLETAGHTITHDWTVEVQGEVSTLVGEEREKFLVKCAQSDLDGVRHCDVLLLLNHAYGKGMFTELGFAIALMKTVVIVRPKVANNIFFHLPGCHMVETVGEGIDLIQKWTNSDGSPSLP